MPVQIRKLIFAVVAWLALITAGAAAPPLNAAEQVVVRQFEHAGRLLQEGRPELAVDEYRRLADSYPNSDLADDALLAIAAQRYAVSDLDGLGRSHGPGLEEVFRMYDRIRRDHGQGNAAPAAIVRMALLRLEPRAAGYALEEARALFRSAIENYPASEWSDDARLGMAFCSRRTAEPARVVADLQPFSEALAASPLAARAYLWRGDAFEALGRRTRAVETYQALRDRLPRAAEAAWARGRALLLMRRTLAARGTARLAEDGSYEAARFDGAREAPTITASEQGSIYLANPGRGTISRLDARGRLLEQKPAGKPALMGLDPFGRAVFVEGATLRLGRQSWNLAAPEEGKTVPLRPAAAPVSRADGSWWIPDGSGGALLEFDRDLAFKRTVWSDSGASVSRSRAGADGTTWLLDTDSGRLVRLSAAGESRVISLRANPADLREPADLAVDPHGAVWVLDAGRARVAVFSPAGEFEGSVALESAATGGAFQALEVDSEGAFLVYDSRERRLRRFMEQAPAAAAGIAEVGR